MIGDAIYELLNVASVTDLATGGIYHTVAPQNASMPYIVFDERGNNENYKNNSQIINHDVTINVYCKKGKEGAGGFLQSRTIGRAINEVLNRASGIYAGLQIDTIYLDESQAIYDPISQAARLIMEYRVRENYEQALADPSNYPINVEVFVNGVLNQAATINGYDNNTINITA